MNIRQRSLTSIGWNIASNWISLSIQFARLILLSRWLAVTDFGVYALASSIVVLSARFIDFGMAGAFVHRTPETEDEAQAAAVQFTFRMAFTVIWLAVMMIGTLLFAEGELRTALIALILITTALQPMSTPGLILLRRVTQQRIAGIQMAVVLCASPIMLWLAWHGYGIWSLLALDAAMLIVQFVAFYLWRPVWRPRMSLDPIAMRYFLGYGYKNLLSTVLYDALDRLDDIWVGFFLGSTALGFYSRAYSLAIYPRRVLAMPVNSVIGGTYAELKDNRARLSKTFFWGNALLIRSGFLLAGLLALTAPEAIQVLLGPKWTPMIATFRLMLVFSLFDPLKVSLSSLISLAGGNPQHVAQIRMIQLLVMGIGLFTLGTWFNIEGVALTVNVMLVVGIALLFRKAVAYVDFSLRHLFGAPTIALTLAVGTGLAAQWLLGDHAGLVVRGLVKAALFTLTYVAVLWLLDRAFMLDLWCEGKEELRKRSAGRRRLRQVV